MEKLKGKIKKFNNEKGYGFIIAEGYNDIFVHYSEIIQEGYKTLNAGDSVEFKSKETEKGLQATEVKTITE